MINFENVKTIFFDYDGTLHNGMKIYAPAFREAYAYLVEQGYAKPKDWSEAEISYWLGFNPKEMWENFMPNIEVEERRKCSKIISEKMGAATLEGKAELYDGSIEALSYLKAKGYHLIFISNCKIYYKESHCKIFNLDRYFERMIAAEEFDFIPKDEILKSILNDYPKDMVMVGDRFQDIECGRKNHIYTIGCSYGYGSPEELDQADLVIESITELKQFF
ncbi:MAG: HAD family hydrolase [Solirubrobacterales bacterium]